MSAISGLRASLHSSRIPGRARSYASSSKNTILYGWGRKSALPLSSVVDDAVFMVPTRLNDQPNYVLKEHKVTHAAAGWAHSLLATESARVYGFGLNRSCQIGTSNPVFKCDADEQIQFLACGREHSHIVTQGGKGTRLFSFGSSMYGQLGLGKSKATRPGTLVTENRPKQVTAGFMGNIIDIACGLDHTVFATDAMAVYAMGWGADGQLGLGNSSTSDKDIPKQLPLLDSKVRKLASSTDFTLALTEAGKLWTWGNSEYGQGMTGAKVDRILEPVELEYTGILDVAAGGPFSVVLADDRRVYTCGYGALGLGSEKIESLTLQRVPGIENIVRIYASTDYATALTASGELFTWGLNGPSGRLGLGHTEHAFTPKPVKIDHHVLDVALGTNHVIALCS